MARRKHNERQMHLPSMEPEVGDEEANQHPVILQLLELAEEQGYISLDDILTRLPEAEESISLLERIYDALQLAGVELADAEDVIAARTQPGTKPATAETTAGEEEPSAEAGGLEAIDTGDTVGLYLSQVGRVPLLTRAEEVELAKRIERGRAMRSELARGPISEQRRRRLQRYIQDGMAAREHMILANSRLVISVAKKYMGRGVPLLDLIQEGHVGLMRAVKKFDYRRGHKFSTYATWWIRQAVTRLIADHGRTIRVPVHMGDRINRMLRCRHRLTQELGREPLMEEIAEQLETTPKYVDYMIRVAQRPVSLEKPTDHDSDAVIGDFIKDEDAPAPEDQTVQELLEERVQQILESLPPREATVLRLRYGLTGGRVHTLKEIGQKMGITRERVRQIEAQALRRLRHPSLRRELVEYVQL